MGITKLILICLIGTIIEAFQMVLIDKGYFLGKPDPDAVTRRRDLFGKNMRVK